MVVFHMRELDPTLHIKKDLKGNGIYSVRQQQIRNENPRPSTPNTGLFPLTVSRTSCSSTQNRGSHLVTAMVTLLMCVCSPARKSTTSTEPLSDRCQK